MRQEVVDRNVVVSRQQHSNEDGERRWHMYDLTRQEGQQMLPSSWILSVELTGLLSSVFTGTV